jgi:hypothetical protein
MRTRPTQGPGAHHHRDAAALSRLADGFVQSRSGCTPPFQVTESVQHRLRFGRADPVDCSHDAQRLAVGGGLRRVPGNFLSVTLGSSSNCRSVDEVDTPEALAGGGSSRPVCAASRVAVK